MQATGARKAAMLLSTLDTQTAAELMRGIDEKHVKQIEVELARIENSGTSGANDVAREFVQSLTSKDDNNGPVTIKGFMSHVVKSVLGNSRAKELENQILSLTGGKDEFEKIRQADTQALLKILSSEHPQTIAVVLCELDPKKAKVILAQLEDDIRLKVVVRMTSVNSVGREVKKRIGLAISERLSMTDEQPGQAADSDKNLRKLALTLRSLESDLRDKLITEISSRNEQAAQSIRDLMVTWNDISSIEERSLQECLRQVESSDLARALVGASEQIEKTIRDNMSERAVATLEEEISLMREPKEAEINDARTKVLEPFKAANQNGELAFVDD